MPKTKKSPSTVAILNFFFWGLGYIYLGKYVSWGVVLTILAILVSLGSLTYGLTEQSLYYVILLPIDLVFAWHGYKVAQGK